MRISQREARRLKKRVQELEVRDRARLNTWANDYPGGAHIGTISCISIDADVRVKVARQCGHAVVAINRESSIMLYAVPVPK